MLAHDVVTALRPGMLCLADRHFLGHALWQAGANTFMMHRRAGNATADARRDSAKPAGMARGATPHTGAGVRRGGPCHRRRDADR